MSFLCYFNILSCFCQRISRVFLSHALSSYPCKRWVLVVIENIIFPLVVCSNTDDHADGDIHTQSRCAAGTQKRQRNTNDRHDFQNHTDIHKAVGENHRGHANTQEHPLPVVCTQSVCQCSQAEKDHHQYHCHSSNKAQCLPDIGENKVVVHFWNRNIRIAVKQPDTE